MPKRLLVVVLALIGLGAGALPAQAVSPQANSFNFYLSAPNVQGSEFSAQAGFTSESFDSFPASSSGTNCASGPGGTGTTSWGGTNHTAWTVDVDGTGTNCLYKTYDQYGGAVNAPNVGTPITQPGSSPDLPGTNYVALGADTRTTINFGSAQSYVGFWYSAGDANSSISFYNGSTLVGEFSTRILMTLLNNFQGNITNLNGQSVATNLYAGNHRFVTTQNSGEPYSFVNIIPSNGLTFTSMTMTQSGSGTRFELDNLVVAQSTPTTLPGNWVSFPPALLPSTSAVAAVQCESTYFEVFGSNFGSNPTYTVTPALPAGLSLDPATGAVTGYPTQPSPQTSYTFTGTAGAQSASTVISLSVAASSTSCPTQPLPSTGASVRVPLLIAGGALIAGVVLLSVAFVRRRSNR